MVSLLEIFITYFKIGAFTIGGGYAMLPLVQNEVVKKKGWLTDDDFLDVIAIVNSLPGMLATNSAGFIGYRIRRVPGFIVAILGCVTPSIVIILILATLFTAVSGNVYVDAFFKGVRPCIVVIMANAVYTLGKKVDFKKMYNLIALIVAFVCIAFFGVTSLYLVIAAIVVSLIMYAAKAKKAAEEAEHDS
ncbi:MAG: chromate transporter [Firmicutes bacterium]|nr:chromate transporter [Bacillota bacterium]